MGTLLYYARAVYPNMLTALVSIATQKAKPTDQTMQKFKQLLDYAASHPDTVLLYQASDMVPRATVAPRTYPKQRPVSDQVDISLFTTTQHFHPTMAQCS